MQTPLAIRTAFWLWIFAAVAVAQLGWFYRLPRPAVPGVIFGLVAVLYLAWRFISGFRAWVDALDLRGLVLLHITRFVGVYFLLLYQRGALPYEFAIPGGIGDIVVAVLALVVVFFPFAEATRARAIYIWNVVGLIDILLVVLTAARIGLSGTHPLTALRVLPLSLLPTFLVPLIIASHLAIFARLSRTATP